MKIAIAADSTCDLSPEIIEENHIKIVPLYVNLGEESLKDGIDIVPSDIFKYVKESGNLPKTSAVPIGEFLDFFEGLKKDADAIIYFSISSGFSSSYQNAVVAADEMENVYVVDTKNLSTGEGLLILKACKMVRDGASVDEIIKEMDSLSQKVDASFVIENLDFLHKGGRCSALAHLGANLLGIKPCIEVLNGNMTVGKKYRGKFASILEKYVDDKLSDVEVDDEFAFFTYSESDPMYVEAGIEAVRKTGKFKNLYITKAGCTITTHCGGNTMGVLFIRKEKK
ncbi:MAG: DegV family protein [Ruminococcaceae bacterium]|nr:DegV family protein [Oscillospiraceae bacterium]